MIRRSCAFRIEVVSDVVVSVVRIVIVVWGSCVSISRISGRIRQNRLLSDSDYTRSSGPLLVVVLKQLVR